MNSHQAAIRYGLIWGAISIATTLILYLLGMIQSTAANILLFIFGIYMMYQSGVNKRTELGGFISWKLAITPIWLTSVVSSILTVIFSWILFKFIDPDLQELQREEAIKMTEKMRSWVGDAATEEQLEQLQTQDFASPGQYLLIFLGALLFYFLIACLIALVVRRKNPEELFSKY